MLEIFVYNNIFVYSHCAHIYLLYIILFLLINNFHVKNFHQLPRDEKFVTTKKIANYDRLT